MKLFLYNKGISQNYLINIFLISHTALGFGMGSTLIDFTQPTKSIKIITDATERAAGLSHAYAGYQDSQNNKSHFFFVHLEPQPNGAAFASLKIEQTYNPDNTYSICLNGKSLNEKEAIYQLIIDTTESRALGFTYKQDFKVKSYSEFNQVFNFDDFSATRRGEPFSGAPYLDINHITAIGLRIVGRANRKDKILQKGLYGLQLFKLSTHCTT